MTRWRRRRCSALGWWEIGALDRHVRLLLACVRLVVRPIVPARPEAIHGGNCPSIDQYRGVGASESQPAILRLSLQPVGARPTPPRSDATPRAWGLPAWDGDLYPYPAGDADATL